MTVNAQSQLIDQRGSQSTVRRPADYFVAVIALSMGFALIAWALHMSEQAGRLSTIPLYDDVTYLLQGFDVYQKFLEKDFVSAVAMLFHQHAPAQSLLAVIGYSVFGINPWSAYATNGILVLGLLLTTLWMVRRVPPLDRLAIVAVVLCTPLTVNLVAEFRPDLYWGLLCGVAVYLIFHPLFLTTGWRYHVVAALVSALALLGKPSAVLPTAALLGTAVLISMACCRLEASPPRPSLRQEWRMLVLFALVVLIATGPFFVINAVAIYNYIFSALVTELDIARTPGSLWFHAAFYSVGLPYRWALYLTLWAGIIAFMLSAVTFQFEAGRKGGTRYVGYAAVVLIAYAIPTSTSLKTYFLGGIFYGTFLIFTVHSLALLLKDSGRQAARARVLPRIASYGGPVALFAVAVASLLGQPLATRIEPSLASDIRAVSERLIDALMNSTAAQPTAHTATVYVPAPSPTNAMSLLLMARWRHLELEGQVGYWVRTVPEHMKILESVDFAVLSENTWGSYPGVQLSPPLLEIVRGRKDFELVTVYVHPNGRNTYLFRRVPEAQQEIIVGSRSGVAAWDFYRGLSHQLEIAVDSRSGVEAGGVYGIEQGSQGPVLWTNGAARFDVANNPTSPATGLALALWPTWPPGARLHIAINGRPLYDGPATDQLISLPLRQFAAEPLLLIRVDSDPPFTPTGDDRRVLGVAIRSLQITQ